ncbi:MAG: hypothetical protein ACRDZX_03610, partial [Acidimicrobiales bacterium]
MGRRRRRPRRQWDAAVAAPVIGPPVAGPMLVSSPGSTTAEDEGIGSGYRRKEVVQLSSSQPGTSEVAGR